MVVVVVVDAVAVVVDVVIEVDWMRIWICVMLIEMVWLSIGIRMWMEIGWLSIRIGVVKFIGVVEMK